MESQEYDGYSNWKGWSGRRFGECDDATAAYFLDELTRSGVRTLADRRVLEIGFGNGEFAVWARGQGMRYSGTEVIPELVSGGRAQGFDVYPCNVDLADIAESGSVDIVAAFDVFEHMPLDSLRACLVEARECLRSGGLLIARMPSGDSPFARAIQYGDLTHRTVLGSSAIRQLAIETGFEVLQVREPAVTFRGNGPISTLRRAAVQLARRLTFPVISALFMGGGSPILSPNMVVLMTKP